MSSGKVEEGKSRIPEGFLDFEDEGGDLEASQPIHSVASEREDEEAPETTTERKEKTILERSKHPGVLIFHYLFKAIALMAYLFSSLLSSNFVVLFVVIVLFLAADFWMVKNISGRFLVGLRWWNDIKDDGESEWRFESIKDRSRLNSVDSWAFWIGLWTFPALWLLCALTALLKPGWLLCVGVALALQGANIYGYLRCSSDAKKRIRQGLGRLAASAVLNRFTGGS